MSKFCVRCGTEVSEETNFCPKCGLCFMPQPQTNYKAEKKPIPGRGFGITSMVLGIVAAVYSFPVMISILPSVVTSGTVDIVAPIAWFVAILAILALAFAFAARTRNYRKQSTAGLILGACSASVTMVCIALSILLP